MSGRVDKLKCHKGAIVGGVFAAVAMAAAPAMALPSFTFAPSALGGAAAASPNVTADTMQLSDYTTIVFSPGSTAGTSNFTESGTLAVTGFQNNASPVTTPGLNTTYGMYFSFTATGTQRNFSPTLSSGEFATLSFSLNAYLLPPSSGITYKASNATPTGVVNPVVLATGALSSGDVTLTRGIPSANAEVFFTAMNSSFFVAPVPFYNFSLSAFTNTRDQVSTSADGSTITIIQGGGTASFANVPEPVSLAIFCAGLAGLGAVRLRRPTA